jgi:transcriptional regulator with GAF, ATPase, and Fis domain
VGEGGPQRLAPHSVDGSLSYHDAVREAKRSILRRALEQNDNVQTRAARQLGITQPYMARLMKNLDLRRK